MSHAFAVAMGACFAAAVLHNPSFAVLAMVAGVGMAAACVWEASK